MPPFKRYEPQIPEVLRLLGVGEPPDPPKRSKLTFKEIADRAQVSQSCVTFYAAMNKISPPKRSGPAPGTPGVGRPKGEGKKFSPYREPAYALFSIGRTPEQVEEELGISRQYVHTFHGEWKKITDGK